MTGNVVQHCRDCKHWERRERPGYEGPHWQDVGLCVLTVCGNEEPEHPDTLAFGGGTDDYCCWLDTRGDFGCVQWAPKEDEPTANELKWTTREGKIISKSDVPRISDRHLANWLAYLTRRHAEVACAAAYGPEDVEESAHRLLDYLEAWQDILEREKKRREDEGITVEEELEL